MKSLFCLCVAGALLPFVCVAQISYRAGYATRLYWSGNDSAQSKASRFFKQLSESKETPVHERGYAKLYLGRLALASGDMPRAVKLCSEADVETDAFWGDELLLEHFDRHGALSDYDRKRYELIRAYSARRDELLRGAFDHRRIWSLYPRTCLACGPNGGGRHWRKYRFMYCDTGNDELRLSACLDFCDERLSDLMDMNDVLLLTERDKASVRFPIKMKSMDLWYRPLLRHWLPDRMLGRIEGAGEVWQHHIREGVTEWRLFLRIQKTMLPKSGTELAVKSFYRGVIRNGKVFLLDVDDHPFESPFVSLEKGMLNVKVHYRTSRANLLVNFFCGPGEEELHSDVLSFRLPDVSLRASTKH